MTTWANQLKKRVPEYFRDNDAPLESYLEFCGGVFDEITNTIKEHDVYKDYKLSPSSRLSLIASRFAFNPPSKLSDDIMRGIIRDLSFINQTRGVENSIKWVFKLLTWDVTLHYAWLPSPEFYDGRIKEMFPSFYIGEDIEAEEIYKGSTFIAKIGEGYKIGVTKQTYINDSDFTVSGHIKIGETPIMFNPAGGDLWTPVGDSEFILTNDESKIDYRNFMFGKSVLTDSGRYFEGAGWQNIGKSSTNLRILGEDYDKSNVRRSSTLVMSTPYIVAEVSDTDFNRFTENTEGGFTYTSSETYKIADLLINYLLHEVVRPTTVKILMVVGGTSLDNTVTVSESYQDTLSHQPDRNTSNVVVGETESHSVSGALAIGSGFTIGAPTHQPVNSFSGIPQPDIGATYNSEYVAGVTEFIYQLNHAADTFVGGEYVSGNIKLRTPSKIKINNPNNKSLDIYGMVTRGGSMTLLLTGVTNTDIIYESYDISTLVIKSVNEIFDVTVDIKWLSQTSPSTNSNNTLTVVGSF